MPDPAYLEELVASLPDEEAIFFLRNKGSEAQAQWMSPDIVASDAPFYRMVSAQGVLRNHDGEVAPGPAEGEFLQKLTGRDFRALLDELRSMDDST